MNKIVIIGANCFQLPLIKKAKQMGYETHVFAWEDGAVGRDYADFFYPISIVEKEAILEKCQEIKPAGVVSIASDLASITVNYLAEKLGLVGNGIESSLISTNKYLMRKAFKERNDPSPQYYLSDEINEQVISQLKFPLIVKPVDRSGSRGVTKIERKEDLSKAIETSENLSFDKKAIVEEFVDGSEYSVEYISYKGTHHFLAVTQKITTGEPHFIETGHIQPAKLSTDILESIKKIVEHALDTLNIKYGASHSEIKINQDGKITIIEIGGRMGGDCIGSDLVYLSTGYDFLKMVIQVACGQTLEVVQTGKKHIVEIRFLFNQGDIEVLNELKKKNEKAIYFISDIDDSHSGQVTDSSNRLGYYILLKDVV